MRNCYFVILLLVIFAWDTQAQHSHQDVLPGQTGNTLLNNLRSNYKPTNLANYNVARDKMFGKIYEEDDTVTCIYTGMKRYLPPNASKPRTVMYDNNSTVSMNTEHTYPQSKVLNSAGKTDLHHIFPSRSAANNGRGSSPFGNIPVGQVTKWWRGANMRSSPPPAAEAPFYSKQNNTMFEPRDDFKGNIARAMFYYYTMYKSEANGKDPNFFNSQKSTLCQWHLDDPVDSMEWVRTYRIAALQNNRVNPFVKDCSLPYRCNYCAQTCSSSTRISRQEDFGLFLQNNAPNPVTTQTQLSYQLDGQQTVTLQVFNHLGQTVRTLVSAEEQTAGHYSYGFEVANLPNGIYNYSITVEQSGRSATFSKRMIIAR